MSYVDFTLPEWLNYLENAHSQEIQLGLMRVREVASRLDLLDWEPQVITVAGTNGKGSTVASLEAIYMAGGYKVSSYTSPHLLRFNERIKINQKVISDEDLCAAFRMIEDARAEIHLTYFEMATLAALYYFKQADLDVIILEVGMGGRLDATNIIDADLAIITTVDLDHQDYLGDTIEAIAKEKAGILRANTPCIYADFNIPSNVLEHATCINAPVFSLGHDYHYETQGSSFKVYIGTSKILELPLPRINLKAAASACMASFCLNHKLPISFEQWVLAMQSVSILGRQQLLQYPVPTLYDGAHNPQAVSLLADFIANYYPRSKVHAVFSGLKDKDLPGLIKPMRACVDHWYPCLLSGKRAATEELLLKSFQTEDCIPAICYSDPKTAYQAAVKFAAEDDIIVVYGSFLMVSAIMEVQEELE